MKNMHTKPWLRRREIQHGVSTEQPSFGGVGQTLCFSYSRDLLKEERYSRKQDEQLR